MVKEIFYDLEFTEDSILILSYSGKILLEQFKNCSHKQIYQEAIARDLHVRFETAAVRDLFIEGV